LVRVGSRMREIAFGRAASPAASSGSVPRSPPRSCLHPGQFPVPAEGVGRRRMVPETRLRALQSRRVEGCSGRLLPAPAVHRVPRFRLEPPGTTLFLSPPASHPANPSPSRVVVSANHVSRRSAFITKTSVPDLRLKSAGEPCPLAAAKNLRVVLETDPPPDEETALEVLQSTARIPCPQSPDERGYARINSMFHFDRLVSSRPVVRPTPSRRWRSGSVLRRPSLRRAPPRRVPRGADAPHWLWSAG